MKIIRKFQFMCQKNVAKYLDLLLIKEKRKIHYVLTKDLNTFMYNHNLHCRKNVFAIIVYKLLVQKKY